MTSPTDPADPADSAVEEDGADVDLDPAADQERFSVRRVVRPPGAEPRTRVVSRDETDVGWGDAPGERDDDWYRRERPPHHG